MPARREELLIAQMREGVAAIRSYTDGLDLDGFLADTKTQDAVCMRIVALSECAAKLLRRTPSLEQAYPQAGWRRLVGLRNLIAHAYAEVLPEQIWEDVQKGLPAMEETLDRIEAALSSKTRGV